MCCGLWIMSIIEEFVKMYDSYLNQFPSASKRIITGTVRSEMVTDTFANIAPPDFPDLRKLQHTERLIQKIIKHPEILLHDFTTHPPSQETEIKTPDMRYGTCKKYIGGNPEEPMEKLWCTINFIDRQPRIKSPGFRTSEDIMDNTKQNKNGKSKM